jgi:hypothetical protein
LGAYIAQASWETSADGIEFMDTTLKTLKASLEAIRDMAVNALNQIGQSQEERSMRWLLNWSKNYTRTRLQQLCLCLCFAPNTVWRLVLRNPCYADTFEARSAMGPFARRSRFSKTLRGEAAVNLAVRSHD